MGISGNQKALMYALGGLARGGATRGGYFGGGVFITIDGVPIGWDRPNENAPGVIADSLQIVDTLDETPNTAAFRVNGTVPAPGAEVVIKLGSRNNLDRLFAGFALTTAQRYAADNPRWVQADVAAVDYHWFLSFKKVTERYQSWGAAAIIWDLVSKYASVNGFTASHVDPNLPVLNEITFTNEDLGDALTRIMRRVGGYWFVDYQKDVHAFIQADIGSRTPPVTLTEGHASLADVGHTIERTQGLTRVYVEGRGTSVMTTVLAGDTMLPVDAVDMFAVAADVFLKASFQGSEGGAQHLNFAGVDAGGYGSLVGPGALPPAGPGLTPTIGAGLSKGVYQYAYTYITASGESLPSPISTIDIGALLPPPASPMSAAVEPFAGGVDAGAHTWTYTYASASGETTSAPGNAAVTRLPMEASGGIASFNQTTGGVLPPNTSYQYRATYVGDAGGETTAAVYGAGVNTGSLGNNRFELFIGNGSPPGTINQAVPAGTAQVKVYRTKAGASGGPWYFAGSASVLAPGVFSFVDLVTDAGLGALIPAANTAQAKAGRVTLSGVSIGPPGTVARKVYRTRLSDNSVRYVGTISDNTTTTYVDTVPDASLGALLPVVNTAGDEYRQVQLSNLAIGPAAVTQRYVYRTLVGGAQLKRLTGGITIGATDYLDTQSDASISGNTNAPVGDTSGIVMPAGQVPAGSTSMLVANAAIFPAAGGWAVIGNGEQVIRYTGHTAGALTGIPAAGIGAIVAAVAYNSTVTAAPMLTGIPASGARAMTRGLVKGDEVYLVVQVTAPPGDIAALADMCNAGDGLREEWVQDRRLSIGEARARGQATLLTLRPLSQKTLRYSCRDLNTWAGAAISVELPAPTNLSGDFKIQQVTISNFRPHLYQLPTFSVQASSTMFSFEDFLRELSKFSR